MDTDIIKLILEFVAKLAWPSVVLFVLFMFRSQIRNLIDMAASLSTMRMKIGGHELTLERDAKRKLFENRIEATLANAQHSDKDTVHNLAKKIASDVLSLHEMIITDTDILVLTIIKEQPDISSSDLEFEVRKRGKFANLGTLTGLEHDGLISGHLRSNPMTNKLNLTDKGQHLLTAVSDEEMYRRFVYK